MRSILSGLYQFDTKITVYAYSNVGQMTNADYQTDVDVRYAFDNLGRMTSRVDNAGTWSWTYDGQSSRILAESLSTPSTSLTVAYAYDPATYDLASVSCGAYTTLYSWAAGRQTAASAAGVASYTYAYDPLTSALTNETVALANLPGPRSIARTQDTLQRPAGFSLDNGPAVTYAYDPTGRLDAVAWSMPGNVATARYAYAENSGILAGYDIQTAGGTYRTRKTFEPNRDVLAAVSNAFLTPTGWVAVSSFDYGNDALARRTRRVDNAAVTNQFGYNPRSELVSASVDTNTYGYAYDPIGNRTRATNNAEVLTYLSNLLNQYTNVSDGAVVAPLYDPDGNLTNYGALAFSWDGENRLVSVSSNGTLLVAFKYDHQSRRVVKIAGSATNAFLYDGWAMVREESTAGVTNTYVYGLDLSGSLQGAGTIGGILASVIMTNDQSQMTLFPAFDGNGNLTDLVGADGTVAAHYEYDPYGNTMAKTGALADANPFRFSTKYLDAETGLYYYGFRCYSPGLGRWVNRDPIEEEGGVNLFGFAGNASVDRSDYLGQSWSINRNGGALAEAVPDSDTVENLAAIIGLDADSWQKWLTDVSCNVGARHEVLNCCKVKIPNIVYAYWAGTSLWGGGRSYVQWNSSVNYLQRLGFRVSEIHVTRSTPNLELQTLLERSARAKVFHGLYFWGEGLNPNGWWRPSDYIGLGAKHPKQVDLLFYVPYSGDPPVSLQYKGGLGLVFACGSNGGKPLLNSGTTGSIWHGWNALLVPFPFPGRYHVSNFIRPGDQGTRP